jgi:glycosyltransferase involved in cell wall biosynthesis
MHKLALVTPWPPQHSGIADYAFDLATGLAQQGVRVSVYTDVVAPAPATNNIELRPIQTFPGPDPFDRVVYQMGNNAQFHRRMMIPLGTHGGIVHLHDMVLHHFIHDLTSGHGQGRLYYRLVKYWYGEEIFHRICNWNKMRDDCYTSSTGVTDVPLFEPVVQFADACIVHSEFCRQRITARFPDLPCKVIPQAYRGAAIMTRPAGVPLRVGAFGSVNPHKHTDTLLKAAHAAIERGAALHVDIAGNVDSGAQELAQLVNQLGITQQVTFHGRVDEESFHRLMQSVDICVALRYPTMGETSGVVSRALQKGIPTIVNDVGWYAELPPFVDKLPTDRRQMQEQLGTLLARHALEPEFHRRVRDEASRYARDVADFRRVIQRYMAIVNQFPTVRTTRCRVGSAA